MAFNGKYEYDLNGIDRIISEKGDYFFALREVRWSHDKEFKNDLRRYRSAEEGDIPLKGCSFSDEEGDELVKTMIEEGFGEDNEIAQSIMENREGLCDILRCLEGADEIGKDTRVDLMKRHNTEVEVESDDEDKSLDDYYDPRKDLF